MDTVDVLLAAFHGWKTKTDPLAHVKHLKPTEMTIHLEQSIRKEKPFIKCVTQKTLARIAALKLAVTKKDPLFYLYCMRGYSISKKKQQAFIVTQQEGEFIRNFAGKQ